MIRRPAAPSVPWAIPPELETICLKRLTRKKANRYQSAQELAREIELFLEGVKDRERRHELAEACAREARDFTRAYFDLKGKLVGAKKKAREAAEKIKGYEPEEEKRPIWAVEDAATAMEKGLVRAFSDAIAKYMEGIGHEPANEEVRRGLSELYWDNFLEAEERDHEADQVYYRGLVLAYGREWYESKLAGIGALCVVTQEFSCDCLLPRPPFALSEGSPLRHADGGQASGERESKGGPADRLLVKFHPDEMVPCAWGSREMREVDKSFVPRIEYAPRGAGVRARPGAGEGATEAPSRPPAGGRNEGPEADGDIQAGAGEGADRETRDRSSPVPPQAERERGGGEGGGWGHGPSCRAVPLAGVEVLLWKYEERGRRLLPVHPESVASVSSVSVSVVSVNPQTAIRNPESLGLTPIAPIPILPGSYLLVLRKAGDVDVRCPVLVKREENVRQVVTRYPKAQIPEGFLPVPGGEFIFGGEAAGGDERQVRSVPDFFVARFPVTCAEYLEFLNDDDNLHSAPEGPGDNSRGRQPPDPAARAQPSPEGATGASAAPPGLADAGRRQSAIRNPKSAIVSPPSPRLPPPQGRRHETGLAPGLAGGRRLVVRCHRLLRMEITEGGAPRSAPHRGGMGEAGAGRGVDGRIYPFGRYFDPTWCNINASHKDGMRLEPVESFSVDESPCGVRGLGGNVVDWRLNDPGERYRAWRCLRGGAWGFTEYGSRAAFRRGHVPAGVGWNDGFRLCVSPRTFVTS